MIPLLLLVFIVFLVTKFASSKQHPATIQTESNTSQMVQVVKSEAEFTQFINQNNLVVVDFFATWCGPCKMIAPMLEKFSQEYSSASFYKVDVDELPTVAASQSVTSMPTLLFFKSGELVGKVIGANPAAIKQTLAKLA